MSHPATDIFDACRGNDVLQVQDLYKTDPEIINAEDHKGFTPLILAVYNSSSEVADFLLQHGAKADTQDAAGNTALMTLLLKDTKSSLKN